METQYNILIINYHGTEKVDIIPVPINASISVEEVSDGTKGKAEYHLKISGLGDSRLDNNIPITGDAIVMTQRGNHLHKINYAKLMGFVEVEAGEICYAYNSIANMLVINNLNISYGVQVASMLKDLKSAGLIEGAKIYIRNLAFNSSVKLIVIYKYNGETKIYGFITVNGLFFNYCDISKEKQTHYGLDDIGGSNFSIDCNHVVYQPFVRGEDFIVNKL